MSMPRIIAPSDPGLTPRAREAASLSLFDRVMATRGDAPAHYPRNERKVRLDGEADDAPAMRGRVNRRVRPRAVGRRDRSIRCKAVVPAARRRFALTRSVDVNRQIRGSGA